MAPYEFVIFLNGFLSNNQTELNSEQLNLIKNKLKSVNISYSYSYSHPPKETIVFMNPPILPSITSPQIPVPQSPTFIC